MDNKVNLEKVKKYFASFPKFAIWMILIGFIVGIAAISSSAGVGIVGFIVFALGILIIVKFTQGKASDQEIDKWLNDILERIAKKDALEKLGIDESELVSESLIIPGPIFWSLSGFDSNDIKQKKGKDGFYRYSVWNVEVFILTENFLANYSCKYNMIKNTSINERTNEFFYKDVVSVKTTTQSSAYTLLNGNRLEESQAFQLNLAGDSVTVITNDANLKVSSAMTSRVDKAVQSIRTMLRQKKA